MSIFIDLTGQRFGSLIVTSRAENAKNGVSRWNCLCDCGNTSVVFVGNLNNGQTTSCGCLRKQFEDLSGRKFGKLTVVSVSEKRDKRNRIYWNCLCDCGKMTLYRRHDLLSGAVVSCGCYNREMSSKRRSISLVGQKFGKLIVTSFSHREKCKNGSIVFWNCNCECGKTTVVRTGALRNGDTSSCGCNQKENVLKIMLPNTNFKKTHKTGLYTFNTCPFKNNTSGVRGVYFHKRGYCAYISFQKKRYHLGYYKTIEEATVVRRHAESVLWGDFALSIKDENPELAEKIEGILEGTV